MYTQIQVLLRFKTDHEISLDDVRAYIRHQGDLLPLEVCYGELEDAEDTSWAMKWKLVDAQVEDMERSMKAIVNGSVSKS